MGSPLPLSLRTWRVRTDLIIFIMGLLTLHQFCTLSNYQEIMGVTVSVTHVSTNFREVVPAVFLNSSSNNAKEEWQIVFQTEDEGVQLRVQLLVFKIIVDCCDKPIIKDRKREFSWEILIPNQTWIAPYCLNDWLLTCIVVDSCIVNGKTYARIFWTSFKQSSIAQVRNTLET